MIVQIKIDKVQLARIQAKFGSLGNLLWLQKPIRDSAWYMYHSIIQNFEQEGRPEKWATWNPAYRQYRIKVGEPAGKILQLAGRLIPKDSSGKGRISRVYAKALINSITKPRPHGFGWHISAGTNVIYAAVHHYGSGKQNIPARPYMMFQISDIEVIERMFQAHINRIIA